MKPMGADDLEEVLGVLLSSGHDPDHLLSTYSWAQLSLFARAILRSRFQMLNAILAPVAKMANADWKPAAVGSSRSANTQKKRSAKSFVMSEAETPEAKEQGLINAISRFGFQIKGD